MSKNQINSKERVGVCSRSFSSNSQLRDILLKKFSQVKFNDSGEVLEGEALVSFLSGCSHAIIALEKLDSKLISSLSDLKVIGKYGVGLDKIDLDALSRKGIMLGWTPGVNAINVAEYTLTMALNLIKNIMPSIRVAENLDWTQIKGRQLSNMTYGIVGCGNVGSHLLKILQPFGCRILVNDIVDVSKRISKFRFQQVQLDNLLNESDIVSLHVPMNPSTKSLINIDALKKFKKGSYLINSSRGGIVNEEDLFHFLKDDTLSGVALDVLEVEPPKSDKLISHSKVLVTPHIGGSSHESILEMGKAAIDGLTNYSDPIVFKKFL